MEWDASDSDQTNYDDDDNNFAAVSPSGTDHASSSKTLDKNYTVLTVSEIRRRQEEAISHVSSVLSLSRSQASLLLCHYNWQISLHDDWFADEHAVRIKVGLITKPITEKKIYSTNKICGICYDEDLDSSELQSLGCDHTYCVTCWARYISTAVKDRGFGMLSLTCPGYKCGVSVTREFVYEVGSEEDKEKYDDFFVRFYVECNKERARWCPAPGCDNAVKFEFDSGDGGGGDGGGYDVSCLCSHRFCWNCSEEAHRPVKCDVVEKWVLKNSSEAENTKWILAFSKPCPKCKRPIEKNQGCNHMTCGPPCRYVCS